LKKGIVKGNFKKGTMSSYSPYPKSSAAVWWQRRARRIRVPLGFVTAALYLFELWRHAPRPAAIGLSLVLVIPGLLLRGYASGYVKKNRELTQTGPYAHTRNPLYLGSILIAAGFAVALQSWLVALVLAAGFAVIYIPVILAEEEFLRQTFPSFDAYCRRVPRLIPRIIPAESPADSPADSNLVERSPAGFSMELYLSHREYNSLIGAAMLYLSLFLLRPVLTAILHGLH
jgi:protein-S-isoprenylcysteine O-methyltransferase Ste14